jgi:hypothetical protein
LFFFDSASQLTTTIAAIGDPAPTGGTIGAIGVGTLSEGGEVAFLAWRTGPSDAMVLRWDQGSLMKIAEVGDPVPGGGTLSFVNTSSAGFADGTLLPSAPTPLALVGGDVLFGGRYNAPNPPFQLTDAYFKWSGGQSTRLYGDGDPIIGGGVLKQIGEPLVNATGEMAISSQVVIGSQYQIVWYRGSPGNWTRVVGQQDFLNGWQIKGMAGSKAQFQALDDAGNLVLWTDCHNPSTNRRHEQILIDRPGRGLTVIATEGDTSPLGGVYGQPTPPGNLSKAFFEWPSMSAFGEALICTDLVSGTVSAGSALLVFDLCIPPAPTSYCTAKLNSASCTPSIDSSGIPSASSPGGFEVRASSVLNHKVGILMYGMSGPAATPFQGGLLCIASPVRRTLPRISDGTLPPALDCSGVLRLDMNAFARGSLGGSPSVALSTPGTEVRCQWWGRDPGYPAGFNTQLTDGLAYRVTP